MTSLAAPKVALKLVPIPKPVLYAGLAGEMLKNTGMQDNQQIQAIQQAVSEQLIDTVAVLATHPDGRIEEIKLSIKPFQPAETVALHLDNGKSYLEALDVSMAAAVQHVAQLITRQGLTPKFRVAWSAKARTTPGAIDAAMKRFNFKVDIEPVPAPPPSPMPFADEWSLPPPPPAPPVQRYPQTVRTYTPPPPPPPGYVHKPVLTVKPEKDPGVELSWTTTRKTS